MLFRFLITFCLLIVSFSASAQDEESQCVRINNFSVEERNQNYPFNKASRIVFASFKEDENKIPKNKRSKNYDGERALYVEAQIIKIYFYILKKRPSKYNPEHFEEKVELAENQKDQLTDLILK